ncbi:MAG: hypothetical protein KJO00_12515 [Bacteroidia bacterium]|nr:hypothetical protein [Bacteroidia bacterium]
MKINTKMILASILFSLISMLSLAQGNPPPPMPPPPPGLPIDGPLVIAVILALIYGVYKTIVLNKSKV